MSKDKKLNKKRKSDDFLHEEDFYSFKIKKYSPEERIIIFNIDSKVIKLKIKSAGELSSNIKELNFDIPYYIENKEEIIISSKNELNKFFHSNQLIIYNFKYFSYFSKNIFEEQYNAIQIEQNTDIRKIFFNENNFYVNHLSSYNLILFKKVKFTYHEFRDPIVNNHAVYVIDVFSKKNVGLSTNLFCFFQKYRNKERANERFIPFLIIKYYELKNIKTIKELYFLLNFAIVNAFVKYEDYQEFTKKINLLIKNNGYNIEIIIISLIEEIIKYYQTKNYLYPPYIIIDKYYYKYDQNQNLRNKIINKLSKFHFILFIVYSFIEKKSNLLLYKYLINDYKLFHYYTYTDNLYAYIEKLPNKYPTIFSQIYPNIVNFLKIQNCQNLQSAEKLIEEEENQVNKYLNEFYENNELKYFYINQIIRLLGKKIKVSDYKDLFLNIPFEIVDFHIIDIKSSNIEIILEIKSPTTLKLLKKIADETIFQVIKYELFSKLNNFIKGGLIEHALIKLIREGNSIFGKFKNIFDIDCFLNKFKSGYNEKIPSERIEKLKNFKKLKMNYFNKEYKGESTLLIPTNSNSKDWDLAFINKNDEDDIGLCISQISINKSIKKIQNMLNME